MGSKSTDGKGRKQRPNPAWVDDAVRQIQQGKRPGENFERLFREYEPLIRRLLQRQGWSGPALDDLVQEIFMRVYKGIGGFRRNSSFATWILRIMSNTAKNAVRDASTEKARAMHTSLESLLDPGEGRGPALAEPADPGGNPSDNALDAERKGLLGAAIEQLSPRVRQCLLFRLQGYTYGEIAEIRGVSISVVKKQLREGHKRLREILGPSAELFSFLLVLTLLPA